MKEKANIRVFPPRNIFFFWLSLPVLKEIIGMEVCCKDYRTIGLVPQEIVKYQPTSFKSYFDSGEFLCAVSVVC